MSKDYYTTLGVSKTATQDEIKKAYRKLAHEHHPDKQGGNEAKFKEINEAYQVLGTEEKRKKYDQFGTNFEQMGGWGGHSWEDIMNAFRQSGGRRSGGFSFDQNGFGGFSFDLGDIMSEFFGGGGDVFSGARGGRRQRASGRDLQTEISIDFENAIFGAEKDIQISKFDICSRCGGNQAEPGTPIVQCTNCGGQGYVTRTQNTILGVMQSRTACSLCRGDGKLPKHNCSKCNGDGMERVSKTLRVKIPAGISDGETIRLQGEGEVSEDLHRHGDLYIRVRVRAHYKFKREGDDIHSAEPISFTQAVLGDKIKVDTIDGKVELKIPPGTASGSVFKLKKKGSPHLRSSGRGDHLVTVKIVVPEQINRRAKGLLEELKKEGL